MSNHRDLAVLEAAELVADQVNRLIDSKPRRLIHTVQLRKAAQSVPANIAEAFGRGRGRGIARRPGSERGADWARTLCTARGEAEETIRHLRANYESGRLPRSVFDTLKNRLIVIVRMLDALIY